MRALIAPASEQEKAMIGQTKLIYNTAVRHVAMFKPAIMRDIVVSVLLVQLVGIVSINITENYILILLAAYFLLWSAIFSRHSFRLMPSTKKTRLFFFGLLFLFGIMLLLVLFDFLIDGILPKFEKSYLLKIVIASIILPFALIFSHPLIIKYVVPKGWNAIRSATKKRPYYMLPIYFVVCLSFILVSRLAVYAYGNNDNIIIEVIVYIFNDLIFFFSAIAVSSLLFAVYKKGYSRSLS